MPKPERERWRRVMLDEVSDFDVDDPEDFAGEPGVALLVDVGVGF